MIVGGIFSFNNGESFVKTHYPHLLDDVFTIIDSIDSSVCKTKISAEKPTLGQMLFSPRELNVQFTNAFSQQQWKKQRVACEYPTDLYTNDYSPKQRLQKVYPFREMDFVKETLGVEVQFGKYAFMVYNVFAKMTIFRNLGYIKAGIEIVPLQQFALEMSSGVSYFEQFAWDLTQRGVADIDVPVLVLGVDARPEDRKDVGQISSDASEPDVQENDFS